MKVVNSAFILLFLPLHIFGQTDSVQATNKKCVRNLAIAGGSGYAVTLVGLNEIWYKNNPRQSFTFFNDNAEWKQVDKIGHAYSAFYLSLLASKTLASCDMSYNKSCAAGAITGFMIMLPIEVLDGFSSAYGASTGDVMANAAGALLFYGQSLIWREMRMLPKFSFHRTPFASVRPSALGNNLLHESLKDYNGQTYWLSFDMDKFMHFPKWLNLAMGYGAESMVYARNHQNRQAGYDAYRQYYLSIDFDLTAIKTRSRVIKTLLQVVSALKFPAPAIEFSRKGISFHAAYF